MNAVIAKEMSTLFSSMYRHCKEYVNGTHTKSPNTSIKPKPSVVTSMVVKIAGSFHNASTTYIS